MPEPVQGLFQPTPRMLLDFIKHMTPAEKTELVTALGPALDAYLARPQHVTPPPRVTPPRGG